MYFRYKFETTSLISIKKQTHRQIYYYLSSVDLAISRISQHIFSIEHLWRPSYLNSLIGGFNGILPKMNLSAKYMLFSSSVS